MARIVSKTPKIFAKNATNNGQFGSAKLGTKILSNDLNVIQALAAFSDGWNDAIISGKKLPALEEFQALMYAATYQIFYNRQEGIPEYDSGMTYQNTTSISLVKKPGTTQIYKSLTDNNVGNPLTDAVNWQLVCDLANVPSGTPLLASNNLSDVASAISAFNNVNTKGTDIASASTLDLDSSTGNYINISGTTTITAITLASGKQRVVRFGASLILTNGANLVLPGGANITTAAGDFALFVGDISSVVRCVGYFKASGNPINTGTSSGQVPLIGTQSATTSLAGLTQLADNATTQTGTSTTTAITPAGLASSTLGHGQTWQDVTASRAIGTTYTNSTGRPIQVSVGVNIGNTNTFTNLVVGGVNASRVVGSGAGGYVYDLSAIVPNGIAYSVTGGSPTLSTWRELR